MLQCTMGNLGLAQTERAVSETAPQHLVWKGGKRRFCWGSLRVIVRPVIKFGEPREEVRGKVW